MRFIALITVAMFVMTSPAIAQTEVQDSPPVIEPQNKMDITTPETMTDATGDQDTIPSPEPIEQPELTPKTPELEPITDTDAKDTQSDILEPLVDGPNNSALEKDDAAQTLSNDPKFSTLSDAIERTDLTQTFQGAGPFTIFAPTNAAFETLPQEKLQMLLKPENKDTLSKILTYHVVEGSVNSDTLLDNIEAEGGNYNIETLNGGFLTAILAEGDVYLLDTGSRIAKIEQTDIEASNGIIHGISTVALPKPNKG